MISLKFSNCLNFSHKLYYFSQTANISIIIMIYYQKYLEQAIFIYDNDFQYNS